MKFQRQYHCLIAGLPDLSFGDAKTVVRMDEVRQILNDELHEEDRQMVDLLFYPIDHQNIIKAIYHHNVGFIKGGNLTADDIILLIDKHQLDELNPINAPDYIVRIVREALLEPEPIDEKVLKQLLLAGYVSITTGHSNDFVRSYAIYDRDMRNLFVALNGRKFQLNVEHQLVGEGEVVDAMRKSKLRDFGISPEMDHIESLLQLYETNDLLAREMKMDAMRWRFIDDAVFFHYFSIERVLAYVLKLMIVIRWQQLDEQTGRHLFHQLISNIQTGYEFPEPFNISHGRKS